MPSVESREGLVGQHQTSRSRWNQHQGPQQMEDHHTELKPLPDSHQPEGLIRLNNSGRVGSQMSEEDQEEQEQNAATEEEAQEEAHDKARGKDDLKVIRDKFTAHDTSGGGGFEDD